MSENSPQKAIILTGEQALLQQAKTLVKSGDRKEAYKIATQLLKQNSRNTQALWIYANLSSESDKAISALKRLLLLEPNNTKAQNLLDKLQEDDDPFADEVMFEKPKRRSTTSNGDNLERERLSLERERLQLERERMYRQQSVININNIVAPVQQENSTAFVVGFIAAGFFGFFGVAHMLNGKVGEGIVQLILGFVWLAIAGFFTTVTLGLGICLFVPLHFVLAYRVSKSGAQMA